jgi:hypothetical protein
MSTDWLEEELPGRIDVPTTYESHERRFRRVDLQDVTLAGYDHGDWPHPGRRHMRFVAEEDIHDRLPFRLVAAAATRRRAREQGLPGGRRRAARRPLTTQQRFSGTASLQTRCKTLS